MHLSEYNRIAVIGSPGSGKSFLARQIAEQTGHPLIHMDYEIWQPGWEQPSREERIAMEQKWMAGERWLIDGHWGSTLALRFAAADLVIYLDLPRGLCTWRVLRRHGTKRPDLRPDVIEGSIFSKDFAEFLGFVWTHRKVTVPKVLALHAQHPNVAFIRLTSRKAVRDFENKIE